MKLNNRIFTGIKRDKFDFNGSEIFKLSNGLFYRRLDFHSIGFLAFNEEVGLHIADEGLILKIYRLGSSTLVEEVKVIESKTIEPFTGFENNKIYQLTNGQSWQQADGLSSPSYSAGNVRIIDNRMKVDNWDFYPEVVRIK